MTAALTGTPGVGKTTVGEFLRKEGYEVLDLNDFIDTKGLRGEIDQDRNTHEVDIESLKKEFSKSDGYDIVEGHLSHHLELSPIIVLRCSPDVLYERMSSKDWKESKKKENIRAEIMDVILIESLEYSKEVYEVDTTDMGPKEVMDAIIEILSDDVESYKAGQIDWSSEFLTEI